MGCSLDLATSVEWLLLQELKGMYDGVDAGFNLDLYSDAQILETDILRGDTVIWISMFIVVE